MGASWRLYRLHHDLDFSALVAVTEAAGPSVGQVRTQVMPTWVRVSDSTQLDRAADHDSIPAWTLAITSIRRRGSRTFIGTALWSRKLKTCFDGRWRTEVPTWAQGAEGAAASAQEKAMRPAKYPAGWDEERVRRVLEHYETQSDEEAIAEDEAAYEATTHTAMDVPVELVPAVRELIAKRRAG